ncbi:uncharacterized protein LOC134187252 [Corticium candelabrum]|uniref:uncharacterized protein LOC134187252 n=1 Tax=Corticium candelabrum TaxID=121492 RepID=UPI002E27235C|nr:uncharacterized protein LOC134187252 [Corticium candelabrum]
MKLLIAFLCITVSTSQTPPERPVISETFSSMTDIESHEPGRVLFGEGIWDMDYQGNKAVENYTLREEGPSRRVLNLQRYDMGEVYEINAYGHNQCSHREVTGHIVSVFGFLEQAEYMGIIPFRNHDFEFWKYSAGGFILELGVDEEDRNRPAVLRRHHAGGDTVIYFREFNSTTPTASVFEIPPDCRETLNTVQQL